jgi:hypothetical protein
VSRIVTSISIRLNAILGFAVVLLCTIGLRAFALRFARTLERIGLQMAA